MRYYDRMNYSFRAISLHDIPKVLEFTNKWMGKNKFNKSQLRSSLLKSVKDDLCASFIALANNEIVGVKISFAPGEWIDQEDEFSLSPHLWNLEKENVGYFKDMIIHTEHLGSEVAVQLSKMAIETQKLMGSQAIVSHSWVESPNNNSKNYLESLDFKPVNLHKNFWFFKEYKCRLCAPRNCECTACEMIKVL